MIVMLKPGVIFVLCIVSVMGIDLPNIRKTCLSKRILGERVKNDRMTVFELIVNTVKPYLNGIENDHCRRQMLGYAAALNNASLWAVQMLDSTAKIPEISHTSDLGHFDECIEVDLKRDVDNLYGKYCLVDVQENGNEFNAGSKALQNRIRRFGVCVPNKCHPEDVEDVVQMYLSRELKRTFLVRVARNGCVTNELTKEKIGEKLFKYLVSGLVLWTVSITVIDLVTADSERSNDPWRKTIQVFSFYRNIMKLKLTNCAEDFVNIHVMRVMTIILLIILQRWKLMIETPLKNCSDFDEDATLKPIFDTLIFISGFLTGQKLHNVPDVGTKKKFFALWATQWVRMTPLYAVIIGFYAFVFERIGNGPLWVEKIGREAQRCGEFWWANLSFVNNYISASRQCIAQSWYLAVTSHGFLITLIFMHLKMRKSYVGLTSLVVLFVTTMVLFLWNDYDLTRNAFRDVSLGDVFGDFYIKTHNRIPLFIIGTIFAFLHSHTEGGKDGSTWALIFISLKLLLTGLGSIMFYDTVVGNSTLTLLTSSSTWSFFTTCFVITFSLTNIDIFRTGKMKSVFIPLSRLSYPALFAHSVIQLYMVASTRTSVYVTYPVLIWMGVADVFASYAFAFILYLIIDAPVMSAMKNVFWIKVSSFEQA